VPRSVFIDLLTKPGDSPHVFKGNLTRKALKEFVEFATTLKTDNALKGVWIKAG
jgi:hypothetical protein